VELRPELRNVLFLFVDAILEASVFELGSVYPLTGSQPNFPPSPGQRCLFMMTSLLVTGRYKHA
jgi:hypothetical protein